MKTRRPLGPMGPLGPLGPLNCVATVVAAMVIASMPAGVAGEEHPFLVGSLRQAHAIEPKPDTPAGDGELRAQVERLKKLTADWLEGLPGPKGPGHVDFRSKPSRTASRLLNKEGVKKALKGEVTVELLELAVLKRNRSIRDADRELAAAIRRYPQVAHLDNLVAQYADLSAGLRLVPGSMSPAPMTREGFPFPGTLALKGDIVTTEVEIAAVAAGLARRKAVTELRLAFADYLFASRAQEVVDELARLTRQFIDIARQRVSTANATQSDVLRVEIVLAELETQLENLRDERGKAGARLSTLAGLPPDFALGEPAETRLFETGAKEGNVGGLVSSGLSRRHELTLLKLAAKKLEQVIELQQARLYPDLATGMSDLADPLAKGGAMAFPKQPMVRTDAFLAGKEAFLDEMYERLAALRERRRAKADEVRNEIAREQRNLAVAVRTHRLHDRELQEKSKRSLDLIIISYEQGNATFLALITAQKQYIHHRLSALEGYRNALKATARLRDAAVVH